MLSRLTITFDEAMTSGVACNLDSRGFRVLCKATEEVLGHVKPYSITGSLPLIRELQVWILFSFIPFTSSDYKMTLFSCCQDEGFDVQTSGYGNVCFVKT